MSATPTLAAGKTPVTRISVGPLGMPDARERLTLPIDSGAQDRTTAASAGLVNRPHRQIVSDLVMVIVVHARVRAMNHRTPQQLMTP